MVRLPGFDNRADVQDRDDKRERRQIGTVPRPILHIYMCVYVYEKGQGKKGKRRKGKKKGKKEIDTLLFCGPIP